MSRPKRYRVRWCVRQAMDRHMQAMDQARAAGDDVAFYRSREALHALEATHYGEGTEIRRRKIKEKGPD